MSADAKMYPDQHGRDWKATHDGPCDPDFGYLHTQGGTLDTCLASVESCLGAQDLRWEIRHDHENKPYLAGYVA